MPMQLTLDFTTKPPSQRRPVIQNEAWLDVSEIARGVGFTTTVQVSISLNDALEPLQSEIDADYDQRLFDVLWLAHLQLSLDQIQAATFNFTFQHKHWKTDEITEVILRVRVEAQQQAAFVGLLTDF